MSEGVSTRLDKRPFVVGWELGLGWPMGGRRMDVLQLETCGVGRAVAAGDTSRMLLRVRMVVLLRMVLSVRVRMPTAHHHCVLLLLMEMMCGVVLRSVVLSRVVNGLLVHKDLLVVLTSRAWVSTCCTGCWWSSKRRVRS
jgi:hypothetical protein